MLPCETTSIPLPFQRCILARRHLLRRDAIYNLTQKSDRMPGKARAVSNGNELVLGVAELGRALGLETSQQVRVARRIWGAKRHIDVVLTDPKTRKTLGIECRYQGSPGTAEEKIPSTIQDLAAWPIQGIVVFAGMASPIT